MLVTASYAIASLVEETHMKEDNVIPKVNDPRICRIMTQTLKEAIGNYIPKPLKECTKTRQLNEQHAGKKG
jgi:malic enzyme